MAKPYIKITANILLSMAVDTIPLMPPKLQVNNQLFYYSQLTN